MAQPALPQIQRKVQEVPKSAALVPQSELRCQCSSTCKNAVKRGETFCSQHSNFCPVIGRLSGWEPKYNPALYNNDKSIQHSHNCFAYSMDVKDLKRIQSCREKNDCHFHVPGKTKGHPEFSGQMGKTCSDVIARTMADVPRAYLTDFQRACEPGFSKIAVVVDEKNDLHYYRQDEPDDKTITYFIINQIFKIGWWSHKPGGRPVTNVDAVGARIYRPDLASRNYPAESPGDTGLNYNSFCSYMCVPRNPKQNPIQIAGAVASARRNEYITGAVAGAKKRKYNTRRTI